MSMFTPVKQTRDNLCVKCEKVFPTWSQYHAHVTNAVCSRVKLVPVNTSGRSKAQIVRDWEARQKPGVIIHG